MDENRDTLAVLLAYLFAQDIRAHPMPPFRQQLLLQAVRQFLKTGQEGESGCGKEGSDRIGGAGPTG
jgi:hypothetical protein